MRSINILLSFFVIVLLAMTEMVFAATTVPLTINLSEPVNVVTTGGTPRIAVDVDGNTKYATYASGTGTASLIFNFDMTAGDVDLNGITLTSPIQLNGGTIKDLANNDATLTFTVPDTSNVKVNYPSLDMDFVNGANGRYTLNGTVYNDITSFLSASSGSFTRNSTATYFDNNGTIQTAAANQPRFDHDPVTHAAKGVLFEESRTNYVLQSNNISTLTLPWANYCKAPTLSSDTDPLGYYAIKFTTDGSASCGDHYSGIQNVNTTAPTTGLWAISFRAKISRPDVASLSVSIDDNSFSELGLYIDGVYIANTRFINGHIPDTNWHNYELRSNVTSRTNNRVFQIRVNDPVPVEISISRVQSEIGAFATSYIPTTATATTRAADVLNIPSGSWLNASTGSVFMSGEPIPLINAPIINISGSNIIRNDTSRTFWIEPNPNFGAAGASGSAAWKIAMTYSSGLRRASANGSSVTGNTTGLTATSLGTDSGGRINTQIKQIKYYPALVSNTQLQLLSQ